MKISYISPFLLAAPFLAVRVSDSLSFGLLDLMAAPFAVLIIARMKGVLNSSFGVIITILLIMLSTSFFLNSLSRELEIKDLAFLRIIFVFLPALLLSTQIVTEEKLLRITKIFFWGGLFAILVSIIIYHAGIKIRSNQQELWLGDGLGPRLRAGGILGNSSDFGYFASVWATICGLGIMVFAHQRKVLYVSIILAVSLYATWISSSRGAALHIVVAYAIVIPFLLGRKDAVIATFLAVLALITLPFAFSDLSIKIPNNTLGALYRLDFMNISGNSLFFETARFQNWASFVEIFKDNFLIGIGYKNAYTDYGIFSDNSFIVIFVEFGLLCGLTFLGFWIGLAFQSLRMTFKDKRAAVVFAMVMSEIFHATTLDTITIWYAFPYEMVFIAAYLKFFGSRPVTDYSPEDRVTDSVYSAPEKSSAP